MKYFLYAACVFVHSLKEMTLSVGQVLTEKVKERQNHAIPFKLNLGFCSVEATTKPAQAANTVPMFMPVQLCFHDV